MTQLSGNCFATGDSLSLDEASTLIAARVPVVAGTEIVPLGEADGRIAAEDLVAATDLPPHDNSAVDGYALRHADLGPGATVLDISGRVAAGDPAGLNLAAGNAIRIFTGAPMPAGADSVVMQEDVRREGDSIVLPPGLPHGANRRHAGEDAKAGDIVVRAGTTLHPQHLAIAAATGTHRIAVRRRLRVALFSTGSELVEAGETPQSGQIRDSNRPLLAALLRRAGAELRDLGILRDDAALVAARLRQAAAEADLVVTSGGVSAGEEDHVAAVLAREGELAFWHLAIKPGRPVAMGLIDGTPVLGLPGNPVAAYVTCLFVVVPLLARLGGASPPKPVSLSLRAGFAHRKKAGRREFLRVSLREGPDGTELVKFPGEGSALLSSLTGSDGLAELPEDVTEVAPGTLLRFFPHIALQNQ